jgi:hypothetical protein
MEEKKKSSCSYSTSFLLSWVMTFGNLAIKRKSGVFLDQFFTLDAIGVL